MRWPPARTALVAVGYAIGLLSPAEIGQPPEILLRQDTGGGIAALARPPDGRYLALACSDGSAALVTSPMPGPNPALMQKDPS